MSEEKATYGPTGLPQTIEAFQNRPCSLVAWDPGYKPPEPEEVDALIKVAGWSQRIAAMIVGVPFDNKKGSTTIRKWRTPRLNPRTGQPNTEHRQIPYSAWRLFLEYASVVTVEDGLRQLDQWSPGSYEQFTGRLERD